MKAQRLGVLVYVFLLQLGMMGGGAAATFVVTNTSDSGAGSLRQAITSANATAGVFDTINFNIPGTGPHAIIPATPLPALTSPVLIDGYSQPGSSSNTLATGDNAVLQIVVRETLVFDTTNSAVRGLAIRQIQLGLVSGPKGSNVVEGCFVGLDATGSNTPNSAGSGVFVQTPNNRIGGTNPGSRNVISGQGTTGMEIFELFASNNIIQGNFIGTDRNGTAAIGNTDRALVINMNASRTTIGGTNAGARNVISGNLNRGITLDGSNNIVQGNFIGTDVSGLLSLGNARTGVEVGGGGNTVGGTNSGAGNVIAFNGVDGGGATTNGVDVKPGTTGYAILGNSIFNNLGLGIDVNANGLVTPPFPLITMASNTLTATVIKGSNTPSTSFLLQLFTNPTADPSGFGEGKTLLVSTNITTDAGGNFTINWPVPLTPGQFLTATANGTTEFSPVRLVTAAGTTNSWTNSASGKWEVGGNWSLAVPPFSGQSMVLITNAGTKTVNNDATTASGFPTTLTVSNLVIGAPTGATNTLLLAHGGTATPLRILKSLNVSRGGAMVLSNAAVSLDVLPGNFSHINGAVTLQEGSFTATNSGQLYIGSTNSGSLTVSGGTFQAYYPILGINPGGNGTWNIAGGTNIVTQVFDLGDSLTATGTVKVTGGIFSTPNIYIGLFGNGSVLVSNGFFQCGSADIASQPGSQGTFVASGGISVFDSMIVSEGPTATGSVVVAGNALVVVNGPLDARNDGLVRMDGGTLAVSDLQVKGTAKFTFNQGLLQTASALVSNNTIFVVGDGTNAAEYRLSPGGTNVFARGLRIATNSSLTGQGVIAGLVTNSGVIAPGGQFGFDGEIRINGGLVLSNNSDLQFEIGGYGFTDFLRTTGSVVLNGKLSVSLVNGFESMMTNGSVFTVMSNSTPFTGAFTNVASGGLLTTTDGYARFTVLYAGRTGQLTNLVIVDSDGDGMPNWWEDFYNLDKNNPADADEDYDGDGATNLKEFLAGTEPNSAFSVFRILSHRRETNNVRLTWTTVGGKSYRVQTNALSANGSITTNFADLSPLITVGGTGESTTNFLHVGGFPTNLPARYYRVRLGP